MIQFHQGKNVGYLQELFLIKWDSVTFADKMRHLTSLEYTENLITSESFEKIDFLPSSGIWQLQKVKDSGVDIFNFTISCALNKKRRSLNEWLAKYDQQKLVLLLLDRNSDSEYIMIGSEDHHALMTYSEDINNINLVRINFQAQQYHSNYFLTGSFTQ